MDVYPSLARKCVQKEGLGGRDPRSGVPVGECYPPAVTRSISRGLPGVLDEVLSPSCADVLGRNGVSDAERIAVAREIALRLPTLFALATDDPQSSRLATLAIAQLR